MDEFRARRVVDALRGRGINAHLARGGVGQFGVRVSLPGGREAEWDTDGTAGLEAQVMRDGMLVGYVPQIDGIRGLRRGSGGGRHRPYRLRPADRAPALDRSSGGPAADPRGWGLPPLPGRLPLPLTRCLRRCGDYFRAAQLDPAGVGHRQMPSARAVARPTRWFVSGRPDGADRRCAPPAPLISGGAAPGGADAGSRD